MKLDVLLTDGISKHTYAVLRALKSKDLKVGIIFNSVLSLSYFSKLTNKRFLVDKCFYTNTECFRSELLRILSENEIDVFIPIGNIAYKFSSVIREEIREHTMIVLPDRDILNIAQDKEKTFNYALEHEIPCSKTFFTKDRKDIYGISLVINYPCVIKKVNYNETGVKYCNDKAELVKEFEVYSKCLKPVDKFPIVQEYISGKGYGFYALYHNGKCNAYIMQERIHEFPITGGSSTLAKSFYDENLLKSGMKVLDSLKWNGIVMVEFKKDCKTNEYKLIEINPKFWGSLELSYVAGINFPYLVYLTALGKNLPESSYKKDLYFRWTIPHDYIWLKFASKKEKHEFKKLRKEIILYDNIHYDDPLTIVYNILFTFYKFFTEKKYPHGLVNK